MIADAIAAAADRFAAGGYDVVVDGVLGMWGLDPWRALGRPISYAVLLPDATVARRRAADRGEHPLKDLDVVDQMHAAFVAHLEGYERHVIDSTDLDAADDAPPRSAAASTPASSSSADQPTSRSIRLEGGGERIGSSPGLNIVRSPARSNRIAMRVDTALARTRANTSCHSEVLQRTAEVVLGDGDRLAAGRRTRARPADEVAADLLEGEEPRQIHLGRADARHVPVEDRPRAQPLGIEHHVAEANVAPQQRRRRLPGGPMAPGTTPAPPPGRRAASRRWPSRGSAPTTRARR